MLARSELATRFPVQIREPIDRKGSLVVLLLVVFGILSLGLKASSGGFVGLLVVTPFLVALAAITWRFSRMCVRVGVTGVAVLNPLRTRSAEWNEIQRVTVGDPGAWFWTASPVVRLRSGEEIPMPAIQSPNLIARPTDRFGDRAAEFLNALIEESRVSAGELRDPSLIEAAAERYKISVRR